MRTVPDPSRKSIHYLKTRTDVYLGRFDLGDDIDVVAGDRASGTVSFYPFENRVLQGLMESRGFRRFLRFELASRIPEAEGDIPLRDPIPLHALNVPEFSVPWQVRTPGSFRGGEILVRGRIQDEQDARPPHVTAAPPIFEDRITLTKKSKLTAAYEEIGVAFAALTGILGIVGGFAIKALDLLGILFGKRTARESGA